MLLCYKAIVVPVTLAQSTAMMEQTQCIQYFFCYWQQKKVKFDCQRGAVIYIISSFNYILVALTLTVYFELVLYLGKVSPGQTAFFKPDTHPQPAPGFLKLFSKKCVCLYVCMYICLSFRTHVSKPFT